ncbi:YbhN family protein [Actinoplanes sp. NPDC049265]|uniref:lysylphosphatidylglycerol synthase transmembrane domain-containing protein n=1 Tax=Actinoplanes sp. NPDC049265 TaxID=3363902 RepID=UPI0037109FB2
MTNDQATSYRKVTRSLLIVAVVVVLAVVGLRGRLPSPGDVWDALLRADLGWVALAAAFQAASIGAFALQQRQLLSGLGVRLATHHVFGIVLASTAVAIAVPAGGVVATAYTVRAYQRVGATREQALASVVVSGLASIGGLALLYAGGSLALSTTLVRGRPLLTVAGLAVLTVVVLVAGRRYLRGRGPGDRAGDGRVARLMRSAVASAREAWRAGARISVRDWVVALAYGTVKWLGDLLCLVAAVYALGRGVNPAALAGIYLSVQIVRQVPLTPGGIGVVEAALIAGLTAAGMDAAGAAAAVLIYRVLSCWLVVPVGGLAALALRTGGRRSIAVRGCTEETSSPM